MKSGELLPIRRRCKAGCGRDAHYHYDDVIMSAIASQITSLAIVYSTVYSDVDQRKHQSSASLAFVRGIHRHRWIPPQRASNAENLSIWWRHHVIDNESVYLLSSVTRNPWKRTWSVARFRKFSSAIMIIKILFKLINKNWQNHVFAVMAMDADGLVPLGARASANTPAVKLFHMCWPVTCQWAMLSLVYV